MSTAAAGRSIRGSLSPNMLSYAAGAVLGFLLCLLIGAAIAFLPWWLALSLVLAPAVVIGGAVWPFPILLLALALLFQAIPGRFVPPVGSFRIDELVILYLAVVATLRAVWRQENPLARLGPFIWPLIYLYACVVMSAAYVKFFSPNPSLLSELRSFVIWLLLPLLAYVVDTERKRKILMTCVVGVAVLVSIYVMTESFFHVALLASRVEALDAANMDVTRSIAGGTTYLMVLSLLWSVNGMTTQAKYLPVLMVVALIVTGGIAVSFGRGVWIATALGFVLASWLNRGMRGTLVSVALVLVTLALVLLVMAAAKPRFVEAMADRAFGVTQEIKTGGSFRWRQIENSYAFDAIEKRPLTGVGIGGQYKNRVSAESTFATETQYIHNAYVGLMVKMGVQAIIFPVMMVIVFSRMAYRLRSRVSMNDRPLYAALTATFFVPVLTSITQPEWIDRVSVAALCVVAVSLLLLDRDSTQKLRRTVRRA